MAWQCWLGGACIETWQERLQENVCSSPSEALSLSDGCLGVRWAVECLLSEHVHCRGWESVWIQGGGHSELPEIVWTPVVLRDTDYKECDPT